MCTIKPSLEVIPLNPFLIEEKQCPKYNVEISHFNFIGKCLDDAVVDKETEGLTFEVKIECLVCGNELYGTLWLVEINEESNFDKRQKGL